MHAPPHQQTKQVTDVADAVIMASLFGELWKQGVVVLATSNRAPADLYLDGLNRPYFLPFIALLRRQCAVVDMDSGLDHRTKFRSLLEQSYFTPLDAYVHALAWGCLSGVVEMEGKGREVGTLE